MIAHEWDVPVNSNTRGNGGEFMGLVTCYHGHNKILTRTFGR